MKKLLLVCFVILFTFFYAIGQQGDTPIDLPVLSPQSPNAFEFTKYGEINVNESTGAISPSIPLYTYNAGEGISIPIALQYSGNGVKVGQEPTWTGINWNLSPGGAITRQVRDIPDEKTSSSYKKYVSKDYLNSLEGYGVVLNPGTSIEYSWYGIQGTQWYEEVSAIEDVELVDSEVDIFNYNFLGYSGSFYLDEQMNAHLLNYNKELEITFIISNLLNSDNKSEFEIKTSDGTIYRFGGIEASESSRTWTNSGSGSIHGIDLTQNAFYLYEIEPYINEHPTKKLIKFEYTPIINHSNGSYYRYQTDIYEHLSYREIGPCTQEFSLTTSNSPKTVFNDIESKIILSKISSDFTDTYVEFSSSTLSPKKRKLNSVSVKDGSDNLVSKYDFDYITNTANETVPTETPEYKYFLKKVNFYDKNEVKLYHYSLEYNDPNAIPSKWSFAQDHGGYYNGKTSNTTLLPNIDPFPSKFPTFNFADRETDTTYIKKGSLSRINYPTGGYTTFEYETPLRGYKTGYYESPFVNFHHNHDVYPNDYSETLWNNAAPFSLNAGDVVKVVLNADTVGALINQGNNVTCTLVRTDVSPQTTAVTELINLGNNGDTSPKYYTNLTFDIVVPETGSYFFNLDLNLHQTAINDPSVKVNTNLQVKVPTTNNPNPVFYSTLRIKRTKTFENSTATPLIKRYYYTNMHNLGNSVEMTLSAGEVYTYTTTKFTGTNCSTVEGVPPIPFNNLSTSALNNVYADDSQKILYPTVTTSYGGDNFELGGKQSTFRVWSEEPTELYYQPSVTHGVLLDVNIPYATSGLSDYNSVLEKEIVFTNVNNTISKLKETIYEYGLLDSTHVMHNIKAKKVDFGAPTFDTRDHNLRFYRIYSKKNVLKKITSREFEQNVETMSSVVTNEYNTYVDRPSITTSTTSDSDILETRTYYVDDVGNTNITGDAFTTVEELAFSALAAAHRIDQPIQVEQYNKKSDNTLVHLSTQRNLSKYSSNLILPGSVQTGKGATLEDRIIYHSYYDNGKMQEISKADGTHIVYIWGYKKQFPIAKIENATYSDVSSLVANLQSLSDLDVSEATENTLRDALNALRNEASLSDAMITTYTYDPPIGVSSITDPRGRTVYYHYDDFNRLEFVKDHDGNLLNKNEYNYAPQN